MLVGIIIAVPAGPVGVLCIRRTIFHGRLAGFMSGLGAATADAVFGIIAGFGLTLVSDLLLDYQDGCASAAPAFCSISASPPCAPTRSPARNRSATRRRCSPITSRPSR